MEKISVCLTRSIIGRNKKQKDTVYALGLKKIGDRVEHNKNSQILGMINKVKFLLDVKEV
ncbi:50S ribosomal protein L30 [Candidatus Arthromitus sp. SFB-rat-Yit]|uniref:50S ribosomal protein L30 n=1 Tax=Candidatus Arthromitus sp. SFB-rat-Yit TaxID=1041504 RepID=UPI000227A7FC|nr:50S ribosomal protein L30 [Candidatus Arthromitus sp. SFB-rat-Yit]BAK81769.1 ribosomal protein L30 [Candidatus Arthromitus sp. SFB-rat-Yit]